MGSSNISYTPSTKKRVKNLSSLVKNSFKFWFSFRKSCSVIETYLPAPYQPLHDSISITMLYKLSISFFHFPISSLLVHHGSFKKKKPLFMCIYFHMSLMHMVLADNPGIGYIPIVRVFPVC
jgi:hypothetical protein